MVKVLKQRKANGKAKKEFVSISVVRKRDNKELIVKAADDDYVPYLAVDKYALSSKALMKKRKQICHEIDNATAIVLKELNGI